MAWLHLLDESLFTGHRFFFSSSRIEKNSLNIFWNKQHQQPAAAAAAPAAPAVHVSGHSWSRKTQGGTSVSRIGTTPSSREDNRAPRQSIYGHTHQLCEVLWHLPPRYQISPQRQQHKCGATCTISVWLTALGTRVQSCKFDIHPPNTCILFSICYCFNSRCASIDLRVSTQSWYKICITSKQGIHLSIVLLYGV